VTTSSLLISRTTPQLTVAQIGGRQITTHTAAAVVVTNICSSTTLALIPTDRRDSASNNRAYVHFFPSSSSLLSKSNTGLGETRASSRVAVALENNRGSMARTVICMEASQVRPRSESIIQDDAHSQARRSIDTEMAPAEKSRAMAAYQYGCV